MNNIWRGCCCTDTNKDGCPVHDANATDQDGSKVWIYSCLVIDQKGNGSIEELEATDTSHAFTEASYCFEGDCVAVKRGEWMR